MKIYSIYDRATEAYNTPFFQPSNNAAVRLIKNEMSNADSQLAQNRTDFELWHLGDLDQQTGIITPTKERVTRLEDIS